MRKLQTPSEKLLWQNLRGKRFQNLKFRRQHPITIRDIQSGGFTYFIADFYCAKLKLVIELDGKIHHDQRFEDELRDKALEESGYKVVRYTNEQLNNIEKFLTQLRDTIQGIKGEN